MNNIYNRCSIRLSNYDYSQNGLYYITICVQNREYLFGEITNGEMILNDAGQIVETVLNELPQHYSNVQLDAFIVMPNHIHCIIAIVGAGFKPAQNETANIGRTGFKPAPTGSKSRIHGLPEIVRGLKTFSARKINALHNTMGEKLWQLNYYEHIIRDEKSYQTISEYIVNNPANWQNDELLCNNQSIFLRRNDAVLQ
ncbi:hypothetical protein AGMMS49938_14300 [Fibrobacterales bacterium]|nr:hypothetical protein AGMMS49938_14300 [Fibrobacterales bacterium]